MTRPLLTRRRASKEHRGSSSLEGRAARSLRGRPGWILYVVLGGLALVAFNLWRGIPPTSKKAEVSRPWPSSRSSNSALFPQEDARDHDEGESLGWPQDFSDEPSLYAVLDVRVASVRGGIRGLRLKLVHDEVNEEHEALTNNEGYAHFEDLAPGRWRIKAFSVAGYARVDEQVVELKTQEQGELSVLLKPVDNIRGYVVRLNGAPASWSAVELRSSDIETQILQTDENGAFRVSVVEGMIVEASHPTYGRARGIVDASVLGRRVLLLRLAPDEPQGAHQGVIRGVVEGAYEPVRVTAVRGHGVPYATLTEASGEFRVVVPTGEYALEAHAQDGRKARLEKVSSGEEGLVLTLKEGSELEGRVQRADGQAAQTYVLSWFKPSSQRSKRTIIDSEGFFSISNVEAGTYVVEAEAGPNGYAWAPSVNVPNEGRGYVELRLEAPGSISGRIIDADELTPIKGASIRLERLPGGGRVSGPVLSDSQGMFELGGIPPGRRSIVVSASRYQTRIISALEIYGSLENGPYEWSLRQAQEGDSSLEFVGIGARLSRNSKGLVLGQLTAGGGAAEAGLRPGMLIVAVNGQEVEQLGLDGAIQAIRGEEGTTVQLTVASDEGTRVVTVLRRRLRAG